MDNLRRLALAYAEDIALAIGWLLVSVGTGLVAGYQYGMVVAGALLIVYGVWITKGGE